MADTPDLGSGASAWGFNSPPSHHIPLNINGTRTGQNPQLARVSGVSKKHAPDISEHSPDIKNSPFCATSVLQACNDPDLDRVVSAWPSLPEAIKKTITRLAKTNRGRR